MKSRDKCSVEVTASLLEKSSRYGDVSNGILCKRLPHSYIKNSGKLLLLVHLEKNFRAFNFRHLGNWRKIFNGENFPIYGMNAISFLGLSHNMKLKTCYCY